MKHKNAEHKPEPPFFDENGFFSFREASLLEHTFTRLKPLPDKLVRWFERFEDHCVMECCGVNALNFKPAIEWDERWVYNVQILKMLQQLQSDVENASEEVVLIPELQYLFHKSDCLFLLNYLQEQMHQSVQYQSHLKSL